MQKPIIKFKVGQVFEYDNRHNFIAIGKIVGLREVCSKNIISVKWIELIKCPKEYSEIKYENYMENTLISYFVGGYLRLLKSDNNIICRNKK